MTDPRDDDDEEGDADGNRMDAEPPLSSTSSSPFSSELSSPSSSAFPASSSAADGQDRFASLRDDPRYPDAAFAPVANDPPPYADLTPDRILDALESIGLMGDGRMLGLNSYENRVYQIYVDDVQAVTGSFAGEAAARLDPGLSAKAVAGSLVAKFYRPGRWTDQQILEEHAFSSRLEAMEVPVVAPAVIGEATLHHFDGHRFAVFRRHGGRAPELDDPDTLKWIGRFVGRIHALGRSHTFESRPTLDIETFGTEPRDWLLAHRCVPADLLPAWRSVVDLALAGVRQAFDECPVSPIRLHGDCHPGNILWTHEGPHFVDFDDCRNGPAVQDLWMLISGDRAAMTRQLEDLLDGYRSFADFDSRELRLIEPLRTLRLVHYCAWIARRWNDPAFPAAFPWFNTQRYWQDRILEMREQIAAMQESPLAPSR